MCHPAFLVLALPLPSMNGRPAPPAVRPLLAFALIALCLSLSSCLCSWRPDVGPVEEEESVASIENSTSNIENWSADRNQFSVYNR
jgi:outer membrane lipoprotein-sorting protein